MAVTVGRIMIESTRDAGKMPGPLKRVEKKGMDPKCSFSQPAGPRTAEHPDALVVIADDHLNVFSFDAIPAFCVRIGQSVTKMEQEGAIEFDRALDDLPARYALHEDLANAVLEQGLADVRRKSAGSLG